MTLSIWTILHKAGFTRYLIASTAGDVVSKAFKRALRDQAGTFRFIVDVNRVDSSSMTLSVTVEIPKDPSTPGTSSSPPDDGSFISSLPHAKGKEESNPDDR